MEEIITQLKNKLAFRESSSANIMTATDGKYHLTATIGINETIYTLRDENDIIIQEWKE